MQKKPKYIDYQWMIDYLASILSYDEFTGNLTWLPRDSSSRSGMIFNSKFAGKRAGSQSKSKYRRIGFILDGKRYLMLEHRVAWAIHTGAWPSDEIDHINHDTTDNRFCNLREVCRNKNSKNLSFNSRNKSGFTGVFWHKGMKKWAATLGTRVIGFYSDVDEAARSAKSARVANGYHENHGL